MLRNSLSWYILALSLLDLIIKTHPTLHDSSHGFIGKNSRYFDDDLAHLHEEISSLVTGFSDISLNLQLRFEPSSLDFKQRPLGVPHLEKVTLFNTDKNKTIDMTSISGSTVHFHSSFFEDKKIPPNGNTSFNVVFLGRTEGFIESSLFIHTSEGFLKYNVKGISTFSHYRIRPIVGVKLPLNSTFSPVIYMHNPYFEPLQILEIYSSGGGFHLELPTGDHEGSNDLWEIPPFQTKAIIRVQFEAKIVQNHTAYVRIKLNNPNEILVVPLEVEVTSTMGIFHPQGFVDFGVGGSYDPPKEVTLTLCNPTKRHLRINSVSTTSKAIKVQYSSIRLPPANTIDGDGCMDIGSLIVDWKTAFLTKDFSGKLIVKYRNGKNRSEIPYFLTVIHGGLIYDPMATTYFINNKSMDMSSRVFKVKNEYEIPVHISHILFPEDVVRYFKVETFTPKVLKVGEETSLFNIKLKNHKFPDLHFKSDIILKTNVSNIKVPLLSYDGKLDLYLPYNNKDKSLNMGLVSFDTKKEVYFMIFNKNPVTLFLQKVHSSIPLTDVQIYGCGSEDFNHVLLQLSFSNLTKCNNLKSNHYAVIKVVVSTSNTEKEVSGHIMIETPIETLKISVHFKVAPGKLEIGPDRLVFDQCFPAKICSHPLRVHSTFNDPMIIESVATIPPDNRISCKHTDHILPQASKIVGHLYLNPVLECQAECYAGMLADTSAQWLKTFSLNKFISDFDIHLVNVFYNRYLNLTSNGLKNWQNLTLRLDTSEVKGHIFNSRVKMSWPSLIPDRDVENKTVITFPLSQVGNMTYQNITIYNPASYNVLVQLVLDTTYPNFQTLLNRLPFSLSPKFKQEPLSDGFFFHNETRHKQLNFFWEMLGIQAHQESLPILLTPGETYTFMVGFETQEPGMHSALLFLRNNLTIMEVIKLKAHAAFPAFKFGNRKPGSPQPLTFDLTDKHLRDCERQRIYSNGALPNLTVKRTFTARNVGDVALYINSFYINDYPCEGYGFRVLDCEPFVLLPNSTKKIDIAFTPDFTMTKITRTLILATSLNMPINYTLYTTIPAPYLSMCSDLIPRPYWEKYLKYLAVVVMLLLFIVTLLVAMLDADRIRRHAMGSFIAPNGPSVQPVLDLRLVGQQTKEEIQSSAKVEVATTEERKILFEDKASQKELEEETKPKVEMERYTVLVPTIGKTKKKLGKRNSNEMQASVENEPQEKVEKKKEKVLECKQKIRDKVEKENKEVLKVEEKENKSEKIIIPKERETKTSVSNIRKSVKTTSVPVYEEETSSTTDSSCSNYEDLEKENQRLPKICSKLKLNSIKSENSKNKISENTNQLSDNKPISFNTNNYIKVKHHRSIQKTNKINDKQNKDSEGNPSRTNEFHLNHNKHGHSREGKKRDRGKDREKKSSYHKNKRHSDKNKALENEIAEKNKNPSCFNIPLPPPTTTASFWGESRAKFSDVVARNDSNTTRLLSNSNKQGNKPIVYVEPYKQTAPVELGPIGSRRLDRRSSTDSNHRSLNEDSHRFIEDHFRTMNDHGDENSYLHSNNFLRDSNNSFFSDEIRLDGCSKENCYLEQLATTSGNWTHNYNSPIESKVVSDVSSAMEDPWNQSLLNSSSYWDSYNPLLSESPILGENSLLNESSLSPPLVSSPSQSARYLWGSSSVWQPWAPEVPRTPTRTPPGFDEFLHRKREEPMQEVAENYNPFNSANLWSQQQNNPWN